MENTFKVESFNSAKVLAYISIGIFSTIVFFNSLFVLWGLSNFIFPNWQLEDNAFMNTFTGLN